MDNLMDKTKTINLLSNYDITVFSGHIKGHKEDKDE